MSLTNCRIAGFPAGRPGFDKFFDKSPFDKIGDDLETQKTLDWKCRRNLLSFFCQNWPFQPNASTMLPDEGKVVFSYKTRAINAISTSDHREPERLKLDLKSSIRNRVCGFESLLRH
jgi:hypothetical protein